MSRTSQTTTRELSYYELYLLDYLRQHRFTQQHDRDFIRTRAVEAAETYEQERRNRTGTAERAYTRPGTGTGDVGTHQGTALFSV